MNLYRYRYPVDPWFLNVDQWLSRAGVRDAGWDNLFDLARRVVDHRPLASDCSLPTDLYEDEANFYLRVDLPGVKREHLDLKLDGQSLTLGVEENAGESEEGVANSDTRRRVLEVPEGIVADQVEANLANGVLTVTLPKEAEKKPRRIEVTQAALDA